LRYPVHVILPVVLLGMIVNYGQSQVLRYAKNEPITGKHYLFPEFREGTIELSSGQPIETMLNYNFITEEIVLDLGHTKAPYPNLDHVSSIIISDISLTPIDGTIYEILYAGPIALLVHRRQSVNRDGQSAQPGYGQSGASSSSALSPSLHDKKLLYGLKLPGDYRLTMINKYFIQEHGNLKEWTKLKQIQKFFPNAKDELSLYVKKEKVRMDSEKDLIKLFEFGLEN